MTFIDQVNILVSYAVGEGYTSTQAKNAPKSTYATILGIEENHPAWSGGNEGRFLNLRNSLVEKLLELEFLNAKKVIRDELINVNRTTLMGTFPNAEITHEYWQDSRVVCIWLDGKPVQEEG